MTRFDSTFGHIFPHLKELRLNEALACIEEFPCLYHMVYQNFMLQFHSPNYHNRGALFA